MQVKKEYLILFLAIAALSAYLFMRSDDQTHFELPTLAKAEIEQINRMVVTKGERTVELKKEDEKWFVGPKAYAGDSIKIKNMVRAAADLTFTALVSESESYQRYGLDDDQKITVQVFAGKDKVRDFAIGRRAPTFQHTFVTLAGNTNVFHARGNIDTTYDHTISELRDETVLEFEKSDITSLTLTRGESTAAFTRREKAPEAPTDEKEDQTAKDPKPEFHWVDGDGKEAKSADIDRLIAGFANLKCNDFLEDDAKEGLNDPLWTITLKSAQGANHLSLFAKKDEEGIEFPAVSSGTPYAFVLHKSRVETLEKNITQLLTPETEKPEP